MFQCPECGEVYKIKNCPCVIMKYKNLQFPEQDYQQLVTLAKQAGFRVSRGRGSQLRLFVMAAANNCVQADLLESCDCDRSSLHDCVCPQCHARYIASR